MAYTYDEVQIITSAHGLIFREKDLHAYDGCIFGNRVAIRRSIPTWKKKACVLAEELGHFLTTGGPILGDGSVMAVKQERRARLWAYDLQIGLDGIIAASAAGCRTLYEAADYLDVPQGFLRDCLKLYREKYGPRKRIRDHVIYFEPYLAVLTVQEEIEEGDADDW